MKLNALKLRNFKGVRDFEINPNGGDISIWGDNATGKTTLVDAFLWLLFDKDSANRKDFEIKTLGKDGQPIHGLEHEATAVLDVEGKLATLRKIYKEKWTKKQGATKKVFTGHETTYFIDDVPVKQSDYKARIDKLIDEDTCKLLTNPRYFPEVLKWQKRRAILLEVCGDVSDTDVIASDTSLAKLPGILGTRSLDDHRKVIASRRSAINKELETIPVRIDEAQRSIVTINQSPAVVTSELTELKEQRQAKAGEIVQLQAGGGVAEKRVAIGEIDADLDKIKRDYERDNADHIQAAKVDLRGLTSAADDNSQSISVYKGRISGQQETLGMLERAMENIREGWHKLNDSVVLDTCPVCKQVLPGDQLAVTNQRKAERLGEISQEGKATKAQVTALTLMIEEINKELATMEATQVTLAAQLETARQNLADRENLIWSCEISSVWQALTVKKEIILQEIEQLKTGNTEAIEKVRSAIPAIDQQIGEYEQALAQIKQGEETQKRIEELKAQEKMLGKEFEKLEAELYLTEQFVRSKVQLLEGKINSRFTHARFKMFEEQINEGIRECCEVTYLGVPYGSSLNNSARINVGLDIINTLSEHYGFTAPIWADNAEAVTRLIPTTGQQIRLYVSAADPILRIESKKEEPDAND